MAKNLVKDFMSSPVMSVDSEETIREAADFMMKKKVRALLVKEDKEYVGIVTKTDFILKVFVNENMDPELDIVSDIMSTPVFLLDSSATMEDARKFMQKNKIGHLAVTEKGKIAGLLSKNDLAAYFGKLV